jgi:hypothetical protein
MSEYDEFVAATAGHRTTTRPPWFRVQTRLLVAYMDQVEARENRVAAVVDKIRYAMDHDIQNNYTLDLLDMFDADSGDLKDA